MSRDIQGLTRAGFKRLSGAPGPSEAPRRALVGVLSEPLQPPRPPLPLLPALWTHPYPANRPQSHRQARERRGSRSRLRGARLTRPPRHCRATCFPPGLRATTATPVRFQRRSLPPASAEGLLMRGRERRPGRRACGQTRGGRGPHGSQEGLLWGWVAPVCLLRSGKKETREDEVCLASCAAESYDSI